MRIVACVNAYQEEAALPGCLDSLRGIADEVLLVDGRYADFPGYGAENQGASTDGTLALARAAGATMIDAPDGKPWPDEIAKRNAYMAACGPGDWLLVVDADERVEGTIDRALLASREDWTLQHYRREQYDLNRARKHGEEEAKALGCLWLHRLFAWRSGVHYEGTHNVVHVGDRMIHPLRIQADPASRFPNLRLRHEQDARLRDGQKDDWPRTVRKCHYYAKLSAAEDDFRKRLAR